MRMKPSLPYCRNSVSLPKKSESLHNLSLHLLMPSYSQHPEEEVSEWEASNCPSDSESYPKEGHLMMHEVSSSDLPSHLQSTCLLFYSNVLAQSNFFSRSHKHPYQSQYTPHNWYVKIIIQAHDMPVTQCCYGLAWLRCVYKSDKYYRFKSKPNNGR